MILRSSILTIPVATVCLQCSEKPMQLIVFVAS